VIGCKYKLDFEYVGKCTNKRELRKIVKRLRAEPYYPDLTKLAEKKLHEVDPNNDLIAKTADTSPQERASAIDDLNNWISSSRFKDARISSHAQDPYNPSLPPIRGSAEANSTKKRRRETKGPAEKEIWGSTAGGLSSGGIEGVSRMSEEAKIAKADNFRVKGNEAFREKRLAEALSLYSDSIKAFPTESALTNRALVHLKLSRNDEAIEDATMALNINPTSAKAFMRRGLGYKALQKYNEATKDLEKALKLLPQGKRGVVEKHLEELDKKRSRTEKASAEISEVKPIPVTSTSTSTATSTSGRSNMRRLLIEEDDDDEDESDEESEVVPIPTTKPSPKPSISKASVVHRDGNRDIGMDEKIPTRNVERPVASRDQPVAEAKWIPQDRKRYDQASKLKVDATALYKISKYVEAQQVLKKAISILQPLPHPGTSAVETFRKLLGKLYANIAACASQENRYDEAAKSASAALEVAPQAPERARWLLRRAQANESLEKHFEALTDMVEVQRMGKGSQIASKSIPRLRKVCVDSNPGRILAEKRRGNAHFKAKRMLQAIKSYKNALAMATSPLVPYRDHTNTAALYTNLALCQLDQKRYGAAVVSCTKALGLPANQNNPSALRRRAMARRALGDPAGSRFDFEAAARAIEPSVNDKKGKNWAKNAKILTVIRSEVAKISEEFLTAESADSTLRAALRRNSGKLTLTDGNPETAEETDKGVLYEEELGSKVSSTTNRIAFSTENYALLFYSNADIVSWSFDLEAKTLRDTGGGNQAREEKELHALRSGVEGGDAKGEKNVVELLPEAPLASSQTKKVEEEKKKDRTDTKNATPSQTLKPKPKPTAESLGIERTPLSDLTALAAKIPKTTTEATNILNSIHENTELTAKFLAGIPPKAISKLFKRAGSLTQEHLSAMLRAVGKHMAFSSPGVAFFILQALTKTARFSLNLAMVDEDVEELITDIFQELEKAADGGGLDPVALEAVKDMYL